MLCAFNAYFESLRGKKIAVLGLGVSNRPLVRLLLSFGCDVTGCDRTPREKLDDEVLELEKSGCVLSLGDTYLDGIEADVVFRTPGMDPDSPAVKATLTLLRCSVGSLRSQLYIPLTPPAMPSPLDELKKGPPRMVQSNFLYSCLFELVKYRPNHTKGRLNPLGRESLFSERYLYWGYSAATESVFNTLSLSLPAATAGTRNDNMNKARILVFTY